MRRRDYIIQLFTSFRTPTHLYLKGRVLKDKRPMSFLRQGPLASLMTTILRAGSRELPDAEIRVDFGSEVYEVITDDEGYFEVFVNTLSLAQVSDRVQISAQIRGKSLAFERQLNVYSGDLSKGLISDIDDTVMVSGIRSFFKLKLLINTVFVNPFRRKPIGNVADALRILTKNGDRTFPLIYLSNSPWNIHDYLAAFLYHNDFPQGELILRDMGLQQLKSRDIEMYNKYIEIEKILIAFTDTSFTLMGDTGEKDFDIYLAILEKYPGRIHSIIMRKAGNRKKEAQIEAYISETKNGKVEMIDNYSRIVGA